MYGSNEIGTAILSRGARGNGPKKITLTKENSSLIFPFELVAGYITSTENGQRNNSNVSIQDYSNFQRVFTGLESMIAKWEDAYVVEKKNESDTFLTKDYKVGRSFRALIHNETLSAEFEPSSISSDFLTEFTNEIFNITIYEDIIERDLFKLYIIPELNEFKWLYISRATRFFHNGKLHKVELELTTLNNKVAKSGASIESFIQRGAPGEGYAWPILDNDENITLSEERKRDVPITSAQVEMSGPAAFNTMIAYGRPTIQKTEDGITRPGFNPKIESPRLLLPLRLETPIPSPENTRPSAETNFYVGNFKPTLQESFKDWKEQFAGAYDLSQRNNYEGVLIGGSLADLRLSNPIDAAGTHTYNLWDTSWTVLVQNENKNTTPNNMTGDSLRLNGSYSIAQLMAHNFFITSHISSLPLSVQQNIAWSLNNVPIIRGFAPKLTLGIPIGWQNHAIRLGMRDVKLIMPSSLAEYGSVLKGDGSESTDVWIPLETFTTERKDVATNDSGINATGTIFKVQYTHRFTKKINNIEYVFDTNDLGQEHPRIDDNGVVIPAPANLPDKLLWDENCSPTDRGDIPGYVIDLTHFKTIAKLNYRQTFFSNDIQVYSGTYQTKARFTGSIRDWVNSMKLSNWEETGNKVINYPQVITAPKPPDSNYPKYEIDEFQKVIFNIQKNSDGIYTPKTQWQSAIVSPSLKDIYYKNVRDDVPSFVNTIANAKTTLNFWNETNGIGGGINTTYRFNTQAVGGINQLKLNYEYFELSIIDSNKNKQTFKININDLINSTSKEIKIESFETFIRKNWKGDFNTPPNNEWIGDQKINTFIKIITNGNNIELVPWIQFENKESFYAQVLEWEPIINRMPELEITSAILIPKNIN